MARIPTPLVLLVALLMACSSPQDTSSDSSSQPQEGHSSTASATAINAYSTVTFQPALTVDPPSWLPPKPSADENHFLTWTGTGADIDRAVRFLSPVGLYDPAHPRKLTPIPRDYVGYLQGLASYGVDISAPTTTTVAGHPATLLTASTSKGLDGSLGCPAKRLSPAECMGVQEFATLHLAVIDVDGTLLLAWARVVPGSPNTEHDFAAFEELLATITFR